MAEQRKIDIGDVVGGGFRTLGRNFLPYLALAVLLVGLPGFLIGFLAFESVAANDPTRFMAPAYWLSTLAAWVGGYLLQAIVIRSSVLDLTGRRPDLGNSFTLALRMLLPMIGLAIVAGIGIVAGLILLIVPGVILYLMWIVAVPALVEERRGIIASLSRSADLTKDNKGRIFLLVIMFILLSGLVSSVLAVLVGWPGATMDTGSATLLALSTAVTSTVQALLVAVMLAALYVELRTTKEGTSAEQLADIFA